ncbi:mechanosensitive ion channel family protein [Chloroflexota bacterium]
MFGTNFNIDLVPIIAHGLRILIMLVVAYFLVFAIRRTVPKVMSTKIPSVHKEEKPDELAIRSKTLSKIIIQVTSVLIWVFTGVMVVGELGVQIAPLLAGIGVASLALGFAAQNIIRDYLYGFFIIMEDWYRVGEVAIISGTGGLVENITLRRTVLRDLDGTIHIFPNSTVEKASNMTREWSRINLNVSVAYKENLDHVFGVINKVCQDFKNDPTWGDAMLNVPHVERVDKLADDGIEIKILGDTKPIRQWGLMGELRKRLKDRFDQEGIEIPWPHRMVYFGNSPEKNGNNEISGGV